MYRKNVNEREREATTEQTRKERMRPRNKIYNVTND